MQKSQRSSDFSGKGKDGKILSKNCPSKAEIEAKAMTANLILRSYISCLYPNFFSKACETFSSKQRRTAVWSNISTLGGGSIGSPFSSTSGETSGVEEEKKEPIVEISFKSRRKDAPQIEMYAN